MQKFIIAIMCLLGIVTAYAENENAATSKEYVDTAIATKQPTIPAEGNNVVMTFDSTADDGIGTKNIYDESASYAEQQNALVTAQTANTAVQMAINGEFYCKEWSTIVENDCWLWGIKSQENSVNALPSGYTKLEYLESTGTQYIDTGISVNHKRDTGYWSSKISWNTEFGYMGANGNLVLVGPQIRSGIISAPGAGVTDGTAFAANTIYDIKLEIPEVYNRRILTVNGIRYTGTPVSATNPIYIFAFSGSSDGLMYFNQAKVYEFKIVKNDEQVFNGIPARRDSDGILGMYDTVTNTFFLNAGTGIFIAGPVVSYLPQNVQ